MRYEEIMRRGKQYHNHRQYRRYVPIYDKYLASPLGPFAWRGSIELSSQEADALVGFLDDFEVRNIRLMDGHRRDEFGDRLKGGLERTLRWSKYLSGKVLEDVDFNELIAVDDNELSVRAVMKKSYEAAAGVRDVGPVSASKILHAVNPELFVMWDRNIIRDYRLLSTADADGYVNRFLPQMQRLAGEAICQVMAERKISRVDAVRYLTPCSHSLAKVLDEYNFMVSR